MKKYHIEGYIIGYSWYGNRGLYPFSDDVDKIPETFDEVEGYDKFGFQTVVGAIIYVYPYKQIDGILYKAMENTDCKFFGEVTDEDLEVAREIG